MANEENKEQFRSVPLPGTAPPHSRRAGVIFSSHNRTATTHHRGVNEAGPTPNAESDTTDAGDVRERRAAAVPARASAAAADGTKKPQAYTKGVLYDVVLSRGAPDPLRQGQFLPPGRVIQLSGEFLTGDLAKAVDTASVYTPVEPIRDPEGEDDSIDRRFRNPGRKIDPYEGLRERQKGK